MATFLFVCLVCVCVYVHARAPQYASRGQKTTLENWFSPLSYKFLGIELGLSESAVSALTC